MWKCNITVVSRYGNGILQADYAVVGSFGNPPPCLSSGDQGYAAVIGADIQGRKAVFHPVKHGSFCDIELPCQLAHRVTGKAFPMLVVQVHQVSVCLEFQCVRV